ncbi:TIGR00730 family Rossman fold protein [Chitinophagaceae bacterium LB-8]|uniref:Cytokinin riboside 5'-monophosphate phosphoribohydrolase n=1 Tax=Paraflavisolibacter caeni TaxID=2982496 RepID=A0A9X3BGZ2_9BACT|nr:TIGR00730 family Rossman fold protein [Paraflavisolibacter caeni]MCU7548662.1 TIGR00730 family Rossman fold protein [Paraflavisolibacter caeni]
MIGSLAIFCGSKAGNNPLYIQQAKELGILMAAHHITMIYGGGKNGLMGSVADAIMERGGTVRGVIPQLLIEWESQHNEISELLVVEDMHQRKRTMYEWCDAALILPGGFGTLDELFELLTWNQLSLHDKKVFILNAAGFYDNLLDHLQLLTREGFLYGELDEQITVLKEPGELVQYLGIANRQEAFDNRK